MRRIGWLLALVVLGAVAAGAFLLLRDGDDEEPTASILPLLGTDGEVPARSVLAVKIDGTERGRPQSGLAQADIVYEELTEGGLTRLLALYHSQDPETMGPVRSARSTDIALLAPLSDPLFSWSGANATFQAAVEAADLVDVGLAAVPEAYERNTQRRAPYNLYASPEELRSAGAELAEVRPPSPLFSYLGSGDVPDSSDVEEAGGVTLSGAGLSTSIEWDWDDEAGLWLRSQDGTPHVDADGDRVTATNVLVWMTPYQDTGLTDSAGNPVPEAMTVGEGDALLLTAGRAQPGRWNRSSEGAPAVFTDTDGAQLRLTPGRTWVEVLPPGSASVLP